MIPSEIASNVWLFTSSLYHTTSTVIRTGNYVMIVDPNWLPEEVYAIREFVAGISGERKHILLFTHSDYDHIIGYGAFPGAMVIASRAFADNAHREDDLDQAIRFDAERTLSRDYALTYPAVDIIIESDGQQVDLGDAVLTCYLSPGHTAEGIFSIVEPGGIWIAGDYLSDVEFPLIQDEGIYRRTLELVDQILQNHTIRCMVPGHGTVARTPAEILRRRNHAMEYIDDLQQTVSGVAFPEEKYKARYPDWEALKSWHRGNLDGMKAREQPL